MWIIVESGTWHRVKSDFLRKRRRKTELREREVHVFGEAAAREFRCYTIVSRMLVQLTYEASGLRLKSVCARTVLDSKFDIDSSNVKLNCFLPTFAFSGNLMSGVCT